MIEKILPYKKEAARKVEMTYTRVYILIKILTTIQTMKQNWNSNHKHLITICTTTRILKPPAHPSLYIIHFFLVFLGIFITLHRKQKNINHPHAVYTKLSSLSLLICTYVWGYTITSSALFHTKGIRFIDIIIIIHHYNSVREHTSFNIGCAFECLRRARTKSKKKFQQWF